MKIGICLTGISYGARNRDFRNYYENFKSMVYVPFKENNEVNIYTTTYKNELEEEFLNTYSPKKYQFLDTMGSHQRTTYMKSMDLLKGENLDLIICTRYDIKFHKKLIDINIDYSKFNFLFKEDGMWEFAKFVTDNLFIFPYKYLPNFRSSIETIHNNGEHQGHSFMHHIYNPIVGSIGEENVHFISPEKQELSNYNSFYDLQRI